jgi:hypothetical protein
MSKYEESEESEEFEEFEEFEEPDVIELIYGNSVTQGRPVREVIFTTYSDLPVNFPIIFDDETEQYFVIVEYKNNSDSKHIQYLKEKRIPNYSILKSIKYDNDTPISLYGATYEECNEKLTVFKDRLKNLPYFLFVSWLSKSIILYLIKPSNAAIVAFTKLLQNNRVNSVSAGGVIKKRRRSIKRSKRSKRSKKRKRIKRIKSSKN